MSESSGSDDKAWEKYKGDYRILEGYRHRLAEIKDKYHKELDQSGYPDQKGKEAVNRRIKELEKIIDKLLSQPLPQAQPPAQAQPAT